MYLSVLWTLSFVSSGALALTYRLDTSYSGSKFFEEFDYFTDPDPTHGFVTYVSSSEASSLGLTKVTPNNQALLSVDSSSTLSPTGPGRKSVRITSKKSWTHGLFVADISHMPGGSCGTWPAFWTLGPDWPNNGEIDIIEGVNSELVNSMALHTSANCQMSPTNQLGTIQDTNCDGTTNSNAGCGVHSTRSSTYGKGFNAIGGGVYAMEWTSQFIKIWFFPRNSIPSNLKSGKPDTSGWGTPQGYFKGNCDIDSHFKNHQIIFDTTFCGDWASNVWSTDATCSQLAPTCNEYVANNPSAFKDAYWAINSVKVYTSTGSSEDPQEAPFPDPPAPIRPLAEDTRLSRGSSQRSGQVQNKVQIQGAPQDFSLELSGIAKGGSTQPPPPIDLDAMQNLGDEIIDAIGPEIAGFEGPFKKERRAWVFGEDKLNIPAEATPSVFPNAKGAEPDTTWEFDEDTAKFGDFVPGKKEEDDDDDKKIGNNIANNIGKLFSLIAENEEDEDTTGAATSTNEFRKEIHAVTTVVSHHIVKEIYFLNGVAHTPTPAPRLRPDFGSECHSTESYSYKGIPASWLRGGPIQKREEAAEDAEDADNLRLPLVGNVGAGAGLNAGVRAGIPGVISADLGVSATATLGAGASRHGIPILGDVAAGLGANLGLGLGGGSTGGESGNAGSGGIGAAAGVGGSASLGSGDPNFGIPRGGANTPTNGDNTIIDAGAGIGGAASLNGPDGNPVLGAAAGLGGPASLDRGSSNLGVNGLPLGGSTGSGLGANAGVGASGNVAPNALPGLGVGANLGIKGIPLLGGNTGATRPANSNNPPSSGISRGGVSSTRPVGGGVRGPSIPIPSPTSSRPLNGGIRGPSIPPQNTRTTSRPLNGGTRGSNRPTLDPNDPNFGIPRGGESSTRSVGGGIRGPNIPVPNPTTSRPLNGGIRGPNIPLPNPTTTSRPLNGGIRGPNVPLPNPTTTSRPLNGGIRGPNIPLPDPATSRPLNGGVRGSNLINVNLNPTTSRPLNGGIRGPKIPLPNPTTSRPSNGGIRGPNINPTTSRPPNGGIREPNRPISTSSFPGRAINGGGVRGPNRPLTNPTASPSRTRTRRRYSGSGTRTRTRGGARAEYDRTHSYSRTETRTRIRGGARATFDAAQTSMRATAGPPIRGPNIPLANPTVSPSRTRTRGGTRASFTAARGSSRAAASRPTRGPNRPIANPTNLPSRTRKRGGARASLSADLGNTRFTVVPPLRRPNRPLANPTISSSRQGLLGGRPTNVRGSSVSSGGIRRPAPTSTRGNPRPNASNLPSFSVSGCISSSLLGTGSLIPRMQSGSLTPQVCFRVCNAFTYAATHDTQCFCTNALAGLLQNTGTCDTPCPGDTTQTCGGESDGEGEYYLTLYRTLGLGKFPVQEGGLTGPGLSSEGMTGWSNTPIDSGTGRPGIDTGTGCPGIDTGTGRPGTSSGGVTGPNRPNRPNRPNNPGTGSPNERSPVGGTQPGYGQRPGEGEEFENPEEPENPEELENPEEPEEGEVNGYGSGRPGSSSGRSGNNYEPEEGEENGYGSGRPGYGSGRPGSSSRRPGNNHEPGSNPNGWGIDDEGDEGYHGSDEEYDNGRPNSSGGRPGNYHRPGSDDSDDEGFYGFDGPDVDSYFPSIPGYEDLPGGRPTFQGHFPRPYGGNDRNGDGEDDENPYRNPYMPGSVGGYNGWDNPLFSEETDSPEGHRDGDGSGYYGPAIDIFRPPYGDDSEEPEGNREDEGRGHRHSNPLMPVDSGSDQDYNGNTGWHNPLFEDENDSVIESDLGGGHRHGHQAFHDGSNRPSHTHGHGSHPSEPNENEYPAYYPSGSSSGEGSHNGYGHYDYGNSHEGSDDVHGHEDENQSDHGGQGDHDGGPGGKDDVHCTESDCGNGSGNSRHENHGEKPDHEKPECHDGHCKGGEENHGEKPDHEKPECHDGNCKGGEERNGETPNHPEYPEHPEEDTECHDEHCKGGKEHGGAKPGEKPSHHEGEHCEGEKFKGENRGGEKKGPDEHKRGGKKDHEEHEYYTTVLTTTYIDICTCTEKTLETFTHTTTIEVCGCEYPKNGPVTQMKDHTNKLAPQTPECPMTTVTKSCNGCGPQKENTVVVTVPVKPGPNFPKETGPPAQSPGKKPEEHKGKNEAPEFCKDESCKKGTSKPEKPGHVCEGEECKKTPQGSSKPGHKCGGDDCKNSEGSPKPGHKCEGDNCKQNPGSPKPYPICEGENCKQKSANSTKPQICEGENCKSKNSTKGPNPTVPGGNPGSCGDSGWNNSNPPANPGAPDNKKAPLTPPMASSTNATIATSLGMKLYTPVQTFGFSVFVIALLCW